MLAGGSPPCQYLEPHALSWSSLIRLRSWLLSVRHDHGLLLNSTLCCVVRPGVASAVHAVCTRRLARAQVWTSVSASRASSLRRSGFLARRDRRARHRRHNSVFTSFPATEHFSFAAKGLRRWSLSPQRTETTSESGCSPTWLLCRALVRQGTERPDRDALLGRGRHILFHGFPRARCVGSAHLRHERKLPAPHQSPRLSRHEGSAGSTRRRHDIRRVLVEALIVLLIHAVVVATRSSFGRLCCWSRPGH